MLDRSILVSHEVTVVGWANEVGDFVVTHTALILCAANKRGHPVVHHVEMVFGLLGLFAACILAGLCELDGNA